MRHDRGASVVKRHVLFRPTVALPEFDALSRQALTSLLHSSGNISQAARQLASVGKRFTAREESRASIMFFCWR
jgi:hypothetical protein